MQYLDIILKFCIISVLGIGIAKLEAIIDGI